MGRFLASSPRAAARPPLKMHQRILKRDCGPKLRRPLLGIGTEQRIRCGPFLHRRRGGYFPCGGRCRSTSANHIAVMCGRVVQSSAPNRYAIVDGMNMRDSRVHNYPPRWNGAPSQDLLVIRRNHKTGEVSLDPLRWGLIPYWCEDPRCHRPHIMTRFEPGLGGLAAFRPAPQIPRARNCPAALRSGRAAPPPPSAAMHRRSPDGRSFRATPVVWSGPPRSPRLPHKRTYRFCVPSRSLLRSHRTG